MGCNKFWGKFSCEAIRALPTFRPGSNRIANLLSNRIGAHRYLPRRRYGKLNIPASTSGARHGRSTASYIH
jgi:hypothetical protein